MLKYIGLFGKASVYSISECFCNELFFLEWLCSITLSLLLEWGI